MYRVGLIVVILTLLLTATSCGGNQSEPTPTVTAPAGTDNIAEKLLLAFDANDYTAYAANFNPFSDTAMTQDYFEQTGALIQKKVGHYVVGSKVVTEVKPYKNYIEVIYKTQFTNEPDGVYVTVDFDVSESGTFAAGIWFNSPKLFQ